MAKNDSRPELGSYTHLLVMDLQGICHPWLSKEHIASIINWI